MMWNMRKTWSGPGSRTPDPDPDLIKSKLTLTKYTKSVKYSKLRYYNFITFRLESDQNTGFGRIHNSSCLQKSFSLSICFNVCASIRTITCQSIIPCRYQSSAELVLLSLVQCLTNCLLFTKPVFLSFCQWEPNLTHYLSLCQFIDMQGV